LNELYEMVVDGVDELAEFFEDDDATETKEKLDEPEGSEK
jgi:hypothetical protein